MTPTTDRISSLTDQQHQAAYADHSIAVTAGAGTGKTHMLAERYLYHLKTGYSPLEIVALTFTEKAATEMRSRIRKTIRTRLDDSDLAAELEAAQISTFHALAARICHEHPDAAGVPADFTILDEVNGSIWQGKALAEAIAQIPSALYKTVPYSLMQTAIHAFLRDPLAAEVALQQQRQTWLPLIEHIRQQALDQLFNDEDWMASVATLERYGAVGDRLHETRDAALEAIQSLASGEPVVAALEALQALRLSGGSQKKWGSKAILDEVKAAIKTLRAQAGGALKTGLVTLEANEWDDRSEAMLPALRQGFETVRSHLDRAKRQERVLDFNDLEIHALNALEQQSVRHYYTQRWRAFLIDEFQDTNPVQGQLLERLTAGARITLVGDVKQAIYGFRRADVRVFRQWCDRLAKESPQESSDTSAREIYSLSRSFRTHHALIGSINTLFAPLLGDLHQPLQAHRQEVPHPAPHLEVAVVDDPNGIKPNIVQRRRMEGQHIADQIQQWISSGMQIHDKTSGSLRSITYGDIAILSRTWASLNLYSEVLADRGVPILLAGGENLLDTREAKDAWALLRFLAYPGDDLALVAVLRSPFFAVSDRTLAQWAVTRPANTTWWQHLKQIPSATAASPTLPLHGHVIHTLQQLLRERRSEAPSRLLQLADRLTGYTAAIANLPNARRREADWDGFLHLIKTLEQGQFDGLSVVRTLAQLTTAGVNLPRPALEAGNAVNLMTIHGSKGLEWPVVIVPDLSHGTSNGSDGICIDPALGVALKLEDKSGDSHKSALYTLLEQRQNQADEEEAKRLLYVALTRSRDRLILTAPDPKGGGLSLLQAALDGLVDIVPIPFDPARVHLTATPATLATPEAIALPPLLTHSCGSGLWDLPVTALTEYGLCPKRFEYHYIHGHQGFHDGDQLGSSGAEIGSLTHTALQHQIDDEAVLAAHNPELPPDAVREALDLARRFRQHSAYAAYRHPEAQTEVAIALPFQQLQLNGSIDLLTPEFVLDFKTDRQVQPHHHRLQLWAYAKATQRFHAHIAYLRHDTVHTFKPEDLEAIAQEAEQVVQHIAAAEFTATPAATTCQICPYAVICDENSGGLSD